MSEEEGKTMRRLPFHEADPARLDFQYLEDLSTAYWYSEVLFAALELRLFDLLDGPGMDVATLAQQAGATPPFLERTLCALERLALVGRSEEIWFNSQAAARYLVSKRPGYMGSFFLYRRYMQKGWSQLADKLAPHRKNSAEPVEEEYESRNFRYVEAMDTLARHKGEEIASLLASRSWQPPVLDIGGGAGALARALIGRNPTASSCLLELPEVIRAAKRLYPEDSAWQGLYCREGDFRTCDFADDERFGLILLGNFLHAYGAEEARQLLEKAGSLLRPDGMLVIHDYFPDRGIAHPHKGALYDLAMMLNTYNGSCHSAQQVLAWLRDMGCEAIECLDLSTDSGLILARKTREENTTVGKAADFLYMAREIGFRTAVWLPTDQVATATWVRLKCRFGCANYGKSTHCPPYGLSREETAAMLATYTKALLVEGTPPSREFHDKLLLLEKWAFLAGFHKALVFKAGPCAICSECPADGLCRHPELARPSMEGSGIDVYATARNAGLRLAPLTDRGQYVKYFGLLLLE